MLNVENVSRSYGEFRAVAEVSFRIEPGEIVGLLGHNGAGKTTIMKMLSGYLEPDSGRITFDGASPTKDPGRVQRHLGYLPESLPLYPEMMVADYLDYAATLKGIPESDRPREIKRVVCETDIAGKLLEPIGTLSRGLKQRVGVAQALLGNPKLLILDEPTNGLDPGQTEQMRRLIKGVAQSATVILSTHIMQEVEAICDRVLLLHQSRLIVDARLEDLRDQRALRLETSWSEPEALSALAELDGVAEVEPQETPTTKPSSPGPAVYRLKLEESAEARPTAARIAAAVHGAKGDLYALVPESRDLETLFHQATQAELTSLSDAEPEPTVGVKNADSAEGPGEAEPTKEQAHAGS